MVSYKPIKEIASDYKRIADNYWINSVNLQQEIRNIGFSEHRLNEIFKDEYGMTPTEYFFD